MGNRPVGIVFILCALHCFVCNAQSVVSDDLGLNIYINGEEAINRNARVRLHVEDTLYYLRKDRLKILSMEDEELLVNVELLLNGRIIYFGTVPLFYLKHSNVFLFEISERQIKSTCTMIFTSSNAIGSRDRIQDCKHIVHSLTIYKVKDK